MFLKTGNNIGVYFDSFGSGLYNMPEVAAKFDSDDSWQPKSIQMQLIFSTVCSQYCIFVLTHLARGVSLEQIIPLINDCCDTYANDAFIFNYINQKHYSNFVNKKLKIVDLPFIFEQASYPAKI